MAEPEFRWLFISWVVDRGGDLHNYQFATIIISKNDHDYCNLYMKKVSKWGRTEQHHESQMKSDLSSEIVAKDVSSLPFKVSLGGCSLLALYIKSGRRAGPDPAAHLSEASLTWVEIQLRASISTPEISLYCTVTEQAWTEPWGATDASNRCTERSMVLFIFSPTQAAFLHNLW